MRTITLLFIALLMATRCHAVTLQCARGEIEVNNGDIVKDRANGRMLPHSFWHGTIENLHDVTFVGWNFNREIAHTDVFINCSGLKFIECSLKNVNIPNDSIVEGGLKLHISEYEEEGKQYKKIECGDGKTRTYEINESYLDVVDEDFPLESKEVKDKIKAKYQDEGIELIRHNKTEDLIKTEDTKIEKAIIADIN